MLTPQGFPVPSPQSPVPKTRVFHHKYGRAYFPCQDRSRFSQVITGFVYRSDGEDISNQGMRKLKENWFWQKQENRSPTS
ncbi:hypothetical protein ACE1CA_32345 [Aerosakkonemataceae cyanobacterium BLCC-F167]|uniref:Uncharacterized protein n=1 Tax=Floridaenema evergladense BLCC-F167 TaxID=3153639 RepID=A0ABV4WVW5_9CYAN